MTSAHGARAAKRRSHRCGKHQGCPKPEGRAATRPRRKAECSCTSFRLDGHCACYRCQLAALVAAMHTASQLDPINRTLWSAYGDGRLGDDEAQGLAELIAERRRAFTERRARKPKPDSGPNRNRTLPLFSTGRRQPRSPDRRRSLPRRQDMVRGNPLPASLGRIVIECERAVAEVIARRLIGWGQCALCLVADSRCPNLRCQDWNLNISPKPSSRCPHGPSCTNNQTGPANGGRRVRRPYA